MRGERIFASTSAYINSGKTNISMSDNVHADDFSSSDMGFILGVPGICVTGIDYIKTSPPMECC